MLNSQEHSLGELLVKNAGLCLLLASCKRAHCRSIMLIHMVLQTAELTTVTSCVFKLARLGAIGLVRYCDPGRAGRRVASLITPEVAGRGARVGDARDPANPGRRGSLVP